MVVKTLLKGAARTVAQKSADKLRTAEHLNYKGRPARLNQFGAGVRSGVISKGRDKRQQISDQIKKDVKTKFKNLVNNKKANEPIFKTDEEMLTGGTSPFIKPYEKFAEASQKTNLPYTSGTAQRFLSGAAGLGVKSKGKKGRGGIYVVDDATKNLPLTKESGLKRGYVTDPTFLKYKEAINYVSQPAAWPIIRQNNWSFNDVVKQLPEIKKLRSGRGAGANTVPGKLEKTLYRSFVRGNPSVQILHQSKDGSKKLLTQNDIGAFVHKSDTAILKSGEPLNILGYKFNGKDYSKKLLTSNQITDAKKFPEFEEFVSTYKKQIEVNTGEKYMLPHPGGTAPDGTSLNWKKGKMVTTKEVLQDADLKPIAVDHKLGIGVDPVNNLRILDSRTNELQGRLSMKPKSDAAKIAFNPDAVDKMLTKGGYNFEKSIDQVRNDQIALATDVLTKGKVLRAPEQIAKTSQGISTYPKAGGGTELFRRGDDLNELTAYERRKLVERMGRDIKGRPVLDDDGKVLMEDPFEFSDGGRVELSIGGLANSRGGIGVDDRLSKVGTLESMLAGVGAGLIDIPKGAFTLGAALLDLGFGTSNAAKVEKYFDELTNLDEKAEATFAGDLTRIMVNLGVPGGFAFKKGTELATKALLHKRNGNYFKLTDPKLQERFKTSLNNKGRLFATLGGAGAAGVSDMIFVGDPEHVGTIGDMFGGPTQLKPNDEKNAAREVANRIKFGLDSSLLIGAIGGTGSSIKSLIRRSNDLQTNNDSIDKFLSYLRPRGKKTQEFFDIERENLGLRRSDINRAEEVSRKLDKHIDAIFPFVKNPFNKLGNDGRREFMQKLNDTLLSGDYKISPETGKTEFGLMDKDKVKEITEMMVKKGGSEKDVKGVMEQFYNIRSGWQLMFDDLGTAMGKDALTEFAPLFGKKFKDYLGSTYEIFRNKSVIPMLNYKPTEQAVKKMIKLFKESASDKGVNLGDEQAEYYVNELLASARPPKAIATTSEKTSGVYFNAPDFFINKTTLADMEMPPKTLPLESLTDDAKKVVDELLGKVEDPLQTILTGTNKLSLVTRRNQLFQTLNKSNQEILEKRATFIKENPGKEIPAALRGMFRETELEAINDLGKNIKKIELDPSRTEEAGIVNPLDGMYAERGVAEAIEETAMIAKDKSSLFQLYQSTLLYPKATSQMAKTILSPITHARNFISAGAFAAANGLIPGLTVSFDDTGRAFKEAYGALQIPGARIDNTRYRELLRLGVVNNNVRLGDLQKLLKDVNFGESFDSNVALRNMMRPLSKAKKWTEDMYTAEDDFWKITTFALERSRLKDTYDKYGVKYTNELLDDEAAKIVKNNVPNYDYVNDFVKDLRQLPFGNFVSFPAEIYRTSFNIMNQSWKEIFTPHTLDDGRIVYPLRNIGLKRMFGFSSTVVGIPYGTVEAFKAIHDVTDEEMSALRRFVPDWSKNSTLVPIRDEDGSLKYIDFSHANAYDTMIRPITTMINGVQKGLEEDQVFKNVFLSMIDATKETASPFVSESIWTEALFDVSPIFGRGGRTSEGRRLWTDETPWGDAFYAGIKHLGATVVPGSLPAMGRMRDALTETVDEYGRSYEFLDEALGVAGMRVVDVDPARSMKFKIADFRTGINNSRREFTGPLLKGGPITPEQVVDQYQKANESLFRVQQKMFKDYYAARTLGVTDRALQNTFQDRVSDKQVQAIRTGRFTPFVPSENIAQAFADNAREIGEPDAFKSALSQIRRLIRNYQKLTLGNTFPIIDNPFRVPVTQNITGPLSQITGTPLDNTSLSQPLTGNQQVATAQRGQQVFGSNDPIFGVG
jgi:hypothetical protein